MTTTTTPAVRSGLRAGTALRIALLVPIAMLALAGCSTPTAVETAGAGSEPSPTSTATPQPPNETAPTLLGSTACDGLRPALAEGGNGVVDLDPSAYLQLFGVSMPRVPDCVLQLTFVGTGRIVYYYVWGGLDVDSVAQQIDPNLLAQGFENVNEADGVNSESESIVTYLRMSDVVGIGLNRNPLGQEGIIALTTSDN
jgi:hypothetical protein